MKADASVPSESPQQQVEQQKVADLWMLAILILFFWPFLLIDWLLERLFRRGK